MIGYIYKIESDCKQILYIGSTIKKLSDRFDGHKYRKTCTIGRYLKDSNYAFSNGCELIKSYEIVDRKHLLAYEQLWLNKFKNKVINKLKCYGLLKRVCVIQAKRKYASNNKVKLKQYYKDNSEVVKTRSKERYQNNKDIILKKNKELIICECGQYSTRNHLKRHQQTAKHKLLLEYKEKLIKALSMI